MENGVRNPTEINLGFQNEHRAMPFSASKKTSQVPQGKNHFLRWGTIGGTVEPVLAAKAVTGSASRTPLLRLETSLHSQCCTFSSLRADTSQRAQSMQWLLGFGVIVQEVNEFPEVVVVAKSNQRRPRKQTNQ